MEKGAQERILRAYEHAVGLPEDEREAYLDSEFSGDGDLREVVEALLRSKLGGSRKRRKNRPTGDEHSVNDSPAKDTESFSEYYGDSLPEHYRFIRRLGKGGMGEVILAEDVRLNRRVAIKFLSKEVTDDPERLKRFRYEAQASSALNHPNIVTVFDIGESGGHNFIVCEYVSGETLSQLISRGRLPVRDAVDVTIEICSALAAAHRSGIIHRDIKPDNVILRPDGGLKVLDFGLAKSISGPHEIEIDDEAKTYEKVSTIPGMVMGTPQYMSPEQARGRDVDERSDIFSVGTLLYEMVTGKPPFRGKTSVDVILAVTGEEPAALDQVLPDPPEGLVRVLKHALRKDRRDRYESADAMLADLRILRGELSSQADEWAPTGIMDPKTTARNTVGSIFGKRLAWEIPLLLVIAILTGIIIYNFSAGTGSEPGARDFGSVNITKWTAGAGELINAASFSPDGSRIAFGSAWSQSTKIWFQPVTAGEPVEVTKEDFYSQYPVWSPDGEEIAFFSNRTGEPGIWKVPYTGGRPAKIVDGVEAAAALKYWSKSGRIYFRSGVDLYSVSAQGGKATAVTSFEKEGKNPRVLEISRDESKLAFSVLEDDTWKLNVRPTAGGDSVEIASSPEPIEQAAWGPDGGQVYFSGRVDGVYQVFRAPVNGGDPVQISNGQQDSLVEDVSLDGKKILYSSIEESSDLWLVNTTSGEEDLVADEVAVEIWADFSPDGKALVYQSAAKAGLPWESEIMSLSLDGSKNAIDLTSSGFSPIFSNDGRSVAYFVSKNGRAEIWKVGANGGDPLKLADGELRTPDFMMSPYLKVGSHHISWSPSNDKLAYAKRENGRSAIWSVPAEGGPARKLAESENENDNFCCPEWSRSGDTMIFWSRAKPGIFASRGANAIWSAVDGSLRPKLLYSTNDRLLLLGFDSEGKAAVFLTAPSNTGMPAIPEKTLIRAVGLESGEVTELGKLDHAYFFNVQISPDGRSLAYATQDNGASVIKVRSLEGGAEKILLLEKDPKVLISSLEWSPDGTRIVFGRQSRSNLLSMFVK